MILPLLPFGLTWLFLLLLFQITPPIPGENRSWRVSFLQATVILGVINLLLYEILSLFHAVRATPVLVFWTLLSIILSIFVGIHLVVKRSKFVLPGLNSKIPIPIFSIITLLLIEIGVLAYIAIVMPPNNWDSMTYHMARVAEWAQHESIGHYATNIQRQISMPPFAELLILTTFLLTKSDYFANLVQWFALINCMVGVSLIARELSAKPFIQLFAVVLAATLPMAILQATSTQNDLVLSAFIIIFVYFSIRQIKNPNSFLISIFSGISLGISLYTKTVGYLFLFPFGLLLGFFCIKAAFQNKNKLSVLSFLLTATFALGINSGYFLRNYMTFQNPLGPDFGTTSELFSWNAISSNVIRNIALHIPDKKDFGWMNIPAHFAMQGLFNLHELTGFSPTDPRTTSSDGDIFDFPTGFNNDEDFSGNPFQFGLLLFIPLLLFIWRENKALLVYITCIFVGALLYCIVLKWQIWGSRLQLPLFMLSAPGIAVAYSKLKRQILLFISFTALFLSSFWVFFNQTRPFFETPFFISKPREAWYFVKKPELYQNFYQISEKVSALKCQKIGLIFREDDWEYPLRVIASQQGISLDFEHIKVTNPSSKYSTSTFSPCSIIYYRGYSISQMPTIYYGESFDMAYSPK
jgi:hypothetical protein